MSGRSLTTGDEGKSFVPFGSRAAVVNFFSIHSHHGESRCHGHWAVIMPQGDLVMNVGSLVIIIGYCVCN